MGLLSFFFTGTDFKVKRVKILISVRCLEVKMFLEEEECSKEAYHHSGANSHVMNAKINYTITSPTSREMILPLSKQKTEKRRSLQRKTFRAQG